MVTVFLLSYGFSSVIYAILTIMSEKMVSVIIPVKEKNKYLEDVLEDLDRQTYKNLEVIVETGGSSASEARNTGLKKAKGEYVIFSDGDDHIEPHYVQALVAAMESGPDVIMGGLGYDIKEVSSDGEKLIKTCNAEPLRFSQKEMLCRLFDTRVYQGYVWNKIFKRELIEAFDLGFSEDIRYNEDRLFIFNYLLVNKGVAAWTDRVGYHYLLRPDSVMGALRNSDVVTDAMTTEFLAFSMMRVQLEAILVSDNMLLSHEDAREILRVLRQDEIQSQLRLFKKMVGRKNIFRYRKSPMRRYARECPADLYIPRVPMEDVLLRVYKRYGLTGCTYTSHPEYFSEVGNL